MENTAAFERLLDRANEAMERFGKWSARHKAPALHLVTLDKLISDTEKILESTFLCR
jgi:hypothetical protein